MDFPDRNMLADKFGVAFVGTGNVAQLHERAIRSIDGVELIGVAAATPHEAARQAESWGVMGYQNYSELLEDSRVKVVFVLTPVERHFEHASMALRSGKHVVI